MTMCCCRTSPQRALSAISWYCISRASAWWERRFLWRHPKRTPSTRRIGYNGPMNKPFTFGGPDGALALAALFAALVLAVAIALAVTILTGGAARRRAEEIAAAVGGN